ncbi:MAG: type IV secretory system conjugative DNA transfer family protein [Rhizobium sp.]|nr:type IV secretory system conjugative DNA transfer family protein [Rhizobium sp.]
MGFTFNSPESYRYRPGMLFLGVDERGQEVGIETQRHALTVAGSGAGKGAALLIPNARRWTQNLLVIDPKGEVAANSWQEREALGQTVAILDPFKVAKIPDRLRARFNPLADIDGDTEWARSMIRAIADGLIISYNSEHMEFTKASRAMWAGLLSYVIAEAPPEKRNFATARRLLMQPEEELYNTAQIMTQSEAFGGMIRDAGVLITTALKSDRGLEKSAIGTARTATLWLDEPKIIAALDGQSFKLSDLKNGALSLYLVLPPGKIADYAGFLRLFVKTALRTMSEELASHDDKTRRDRRCLFMLDEFYSLGKLDDITESVGLMRGYGVQLWPFVQNYSQIVELYGQEAMRNYFENSDADIFMGVREDKACEFVANRIGKLTPAETGLQPVKRGYTPPYIPKTITGKAPIHGLRRSLERFKQQWAASKAAKEESRFTTERGEYDHGMRLVGTHRIPPDEIRELIALEGSGKPARSMIVFTRTGAALNLGLAPHFKRREEWKAPPSPYSPKAQALNALTTTREAEEFRALLRNSTPSEILITFLLFAVLIVSVLAHFRLYQCGLDGRGCFMPDGGLLLLYLGSASGWVVLGWVFWEHLKARSDPNAL